jgi:chromosome segregation ATPase
MSSSAHVRSIDAVKDFRQSYATLAEDCRRAIDSLKLDIRRFRDWLEVDQVNHWRARIKRLEKELAEAKTELHRKSLAGTSRTGAKPDLTEPKLAVRRLTQELEAAHGKIKTIQRWKPLIEKACRDCEGQARQLAGLVETDAARALVLLDNMITALEAYVGLSGAVARPGPATAIPSVDKEPPSPPSSS